MAAPDPRPPIERVPVPVDTRAPGGTTNAYVAGGLLVDPAARTDALDDAVGLDAGGGREGERVAVEAIAVTHTHPDHVGAVAEYAELTGASVLAHGDHVDRLAEAAGVEPDGTFEGGETVGDTEVRAVDTPGHAPDHVAFAVAEGRAGENREASGESAGDESSRALLCGDLAVAEGSVVVGAPEGDLRGYLDSLERVRNAGYDRLYPGHGPAIDDPEAVCDRLIDHRLDRERAVLAAAAAGASDVDEVVDAAYEKDLTGVADLARATVVAHLEKLLAEGRIDERWADRLGRGRAE
ncbi:MBL fold metallo-hydrolase [Halorubrum sp. Ea8]|uniref:MBL fold metallo-hydrolase n=1 Tax=Halorubrum sp. Ea8 TaxID=1383841 RepID=UPI000B98E8A6|nr:MBL fold metallo-hydrolase [Halorubrum sp. Ea8]OYR50596.1 MBL fold metallo-hydrolase [Halorubrum sp. Ea8]